METAQSGDWSATATWVGGSVPTEGDAVAVMSGHTVTVSSAVSRDDTTEIVGVLQINNGGTLSFKNGNTLTNNGTIKLMQGGTLSTAGTLTFQAGILEFRGGKITIGGTLSFTLGTDACVRFYADEPYIENTNGDRIFNTDAINVASLRPARRRPSYLRYH